MIELNKVGIEIDGKVYQLYKMSFGFQRKMIELQSNLNKQMNEIAKKYGLEVSEVNTSEKVTNEDKLELARVSLEMQSVVASLFVNKEEAEILDNFTADNVTQLIEALK